MKSFTACVFAVWALLLVSCTNADQGAEILKYENDNIGVDGYNFDVQTSDGQSRQESGYLNNAEEPVVKGSYQYTDPNGEIVSVTYIADKNGFRPEGSHIPQ